MPFLNTLSLLTNNANKPTGTKNKNFIKKRINNKIIKSSTLHYWKRIFIL